MHAQRRALRFASATAAALMSGGVAFAASGVPRPTLAHVRASSDSTTSSTETTSAEPPTTVETTTTTAEETTTTTVEETTTTLDETDGETTTSVPAETPSDPQDCKPGWGYGDTNHCHSGPPGLTKPSEASKHRGHKQH